MMKPDNVARYSCILLAILLVAISAGIVIFNKPGDKLIVIALVGSTSIALALIVNALACSRRTELIEVGGRILAFCLLTGVIALHYYYLGGWLTVIPKLVKGEISVQGEAYKYKRVAPMREENWHYVSADSAKLQTTIVYILFSCVNILVTLGLLAVTFLYYFNTLFYFARIRSKARTKR